MHSGSSETLFADIDIGKVLDTPDGLIQPVATVGGRAILRPEVCSLISRVPEAVLDNRWEQIWRIGYSRDLMLALSAESSMPALIEKYAAGLSDNIAETSPDLDLWRDVCGLVRDPAVADVLSGCIPSVCAAVFGARDLALGSSDTKITLRSETMVGSLLRQHEMNPQTEPLPANLRAILQVVVPALVSSAADTAFRTAEESGAPVSDARSLALAIASDLPGFRARTADFASRGLARGPRVSLQQLATENPEMLRDLARRAPDAMSDYAMRHVARVMAQEPGLDASYEAFLIENSLGAGRELNRADHIWFGDAFDVFPQLKSVEELDGGLQVPHQVPLASPLFHPLAVFSRAISLTPSTGADPAKAAQKANRASLVEAIYGIGPDSSKLLQRVLLGEAAVVGLSEKQANDFFEFAVAPTCQQGLPLDQGPNSQSPIAELLREHVIAPAQGSARIKGADILSREIEARARKYGRDIETVTGPRGFDRLMRALGAHSMKLGPLLAAQHSRMVRQASGEGLVPRARRRGEIISMAPERRELIDGLLDKPLVERISLSHLPMLRTSGLAPGETLEEDAEAGYKVQRQLADRALRLARDFTDAGKIPDAAMAELQTLFGHYTLGVDVYRHLPFLRSVDVPEKLAGGLSKPLEGKHGLLRSVIYGTRFDNSARLKAIADSRLPMDVMVVPPFTAAVVRGSALTAALRGLPPAASPLQDAHRALLVRLLTVFASHSKAADFTEDLRTSGDGWLKGIERRGGPEAVQLARNAVDEFCQRLSPSHQVEFRRLFLGEPGAIGAFAARRFEQHLASAVLSDPLVSPVLERVNDTYLAITPRYPVIHHHSYVALRTRVGDPESNVIVVNPLVAPGLNLDYDGDAIDPWWALPYTANPLQAEAWRLMLEQHSPHRAFLDSGTGTGVMLKLALNASEGLVKMNHCYVPMGGFPAEQVLLNDGRALVANVDRILGDRDQLLSAMRGDSETLLKKQGQLIAELRTQLAADTIWPLMIVDSGDGRYTSLSRLFLHRVSVLIAGEKETGAALGPQFLGPGEFAKTSGASFEKLIMKHCAPQNPELRSNEPGDHLGALYQNFYSLFGAEAASLTPSVREGSLVTPDAMRWMNSQPWIQRIRTLFDERTRSVEFAQSAGMLTADNTMAILLRLENGEQALELADYVDPRTPEAGKNAGFDTLLAEYRNATPDAEPDTMAKIETFLDAHANDSRYGLKPVAKAALRYACEQYAKTTGMPHLLVEQVLTDKVKASDEVLYRFFMGTVNVVDGEIVPTTVGGLVDEPTVERIMLSGLPAADKAMRSKTEVSVPGTAFKDYELAMSAVTITARSDGPANADKWTGRTMNYTIAEYAADKGSLQYLVHNLTLRNLRLDPQTVSPEIAAEWNGRLTDHVRQVPFNEKLFAEDLARLHEIAPTAVIQARSPLFDRTTGVGVSAESIGYLPTGGPGGLTYAADGTMRRVPLEESRYLGYPIGGISSGGIAQIASQSALRIRHITGSAMEEYSHLGDWHRVVHGPFPTRSPFYRAGGDRIRSSNPLVHAGLEDCKTVFTAKAAGVAEVPVSIARESLHIAGVEVFPGERYFVHNERLVVGTDRPDILSVAVNPVIAGLIEINDGHVAVRPDVPNGIAFVSPESFQLRLSPAEASKLGIEFADQVVAFQPAPELGAGVSALRMGSSVFLGVPIESAAPVINRLSHDVALSTEELRSRITISPSQEFRDIPAEKASALADRGLAFAEVRSKHPVSLNGCVAPLIPGSRIDLCRGMAQTDVREVQSRGLHDFEAYLGNLNGVQIGHRAPLSFYTGTVQRTEFLGTRGEVCTYEIEIRTAKGRELQHVQLDASTPLCVLPGQNIERGRPLAFGAVDLAERSKLRPENAQLEFAQYLCAFFYGGGKKAPAPFATELLARAQFPNGEFCPIRSLARTIDRRVGDSVWLQVGRSGALSHVLSATASPALAPGFGRSLAFADPKDIDRLSEIATPAHLFPSRHPAEMAHSSVAVERMAALGLGSSLMAPLINGTKRYLDRLEREKDGTAQPAVPTSSEMAPDQPLLGSGA